MGVTTTVCVWYLFSHTSVDIVLKITLTVYMLYVYVYIMYVPTTQSADIVLTVRPRRSSFVWVSPVPTVPV